jgi:putative redox protein
MTATARRIGDTLRHEVDVNGRHVILTDEPERLGGTDEGPAPHELMAAMLASCVATMISMYAQNRGWDIGQTAVDVNYDNESAPRRVTIDVHLPEDLTPDQRRRLERVAETCPARRALETGFTFEERIVPTPRTSRDAAKPARSATAVEPTAASGRHERHPRGVGVGRGGGGVSAPASGLGGDDGTR